MEVRRYHPGEELELWKLFFDTVRNVNIQDYTAEQVKAWAPAEIDQPLWKSRIEANNPYVCVDADKIVGYADLQASGHIDQFYVHHARQGQGIGSQLFSMIESEAHTRKLSQLTSDVSITARPFFESRGFRILSAQEVTLGTIVLKNFKMTKRLCDDSSQI